MAFPAQFFHSCKMLCKIQRFFLLTSFAFQNRNMRFYLQQESKTQSLALFYSLLLMSIDVPFFLKN